MNLSLRKNQRLAIKNSIENDFTSGVHLHATGTGKSLISYNILLAFWDKYPKNNVYWICEQKNILNQQFSGTNRLQNDSLQKIYKHAMVINLSENKINKWYNSINSSVIWGRPLLVVINRSFLTRFKYYKLVKASFGLIIHDECHSCTNTSTKEFYEYMVHKKADIKCIGFSATPSDNGCVPLLDNILSRYSIYDGVNDGVILPPKIYRVTSQKNLNDLDRIKIVENIITTLPYRKIVIWCGIIDECKRLSIIWQKYFKNFTVCLDVSCQDSIINTKYNYDVFKNKHSNAILFCAAKHREGSDIEHLDCCIFLDGVSKRNGKTFVQCTGRVLRVDNNNLKKYGVVVDFKIKSSMDICDHLNRYMGLPIGKFPWSTSKKILNINNNSIELHSLLLETKTQLSIDKHTIDINQLSTLDGLKCYFVRKCQNNIESIQRLQGEFALFSRKNLIPHLAKAMKILQLSEGCLHVTRGSCGSSYICYLLGISNIDPIKYGIRFSRFLNDFRDNLPDIDFDFPYNIRDTIFFKIAKTWPGCVARISNHIHYHKPSATRKAIRNIGYHIQIPKNGTTSFIKKLNKTQQQQINEQIELLNGTFRTHSLHCGGIVYYPEGIPSDICLMDKGNMLPQITLDKRNISEEGLFKIDILSSRALAQLSEIYYNNTDFYIGKNDFDTLTSNLFCRGDNIGITLGESPLIRKAFILIKPKSISDIAKCLSIIRPMASDNLYSNENIDKYKTLVFDDDAIELIQDVSGCSEDKADYYRRAFAKGSKKIIDEFKKLLIEKGVDFKNILKKLECLKKYSFCKSHAYSYAQLVWELGYAKAHYPKKFWTATLNHTHSNYRPWVHRYLASLENIDNNCNNLSLNDNSIYSKCRKSKINNNTLSLTSQLLKFGYWVSEDNSFIPDCYFRKDENYYYFRGVIANYRIINNTNLVIFLGIGKKDFITIISNNSDIVKNPIIKGKGSCKNWDNIYKVLRDVK